MTSTPSVDGITGIAVRANLARIDRNIARLHGRAATHGVRVRAHVKGHRTVEIARRQLAAGAVGIAVTQLVQARAYVAAGIDDVVIAHPWSEPWRWTLIAELARHCRLSAHVDSVAAVHGLADAAERAGATLGVRIQLGTGYDATATPDDRLMALARAAASRAALRLDGVTAYQALLTPDADPFTTGRATAAYALRIAGLLRDAGLPCPTVAVGGTPTADGALSVPGVTEICSGAYALQDTGMAALGACAPEDMALTVTVTDPRARGKADRLLEDHPYPWQSPEDHRGLASGAPTGTPIAPPHICAVTPRITAMTVYTDDTAAGAADTRGGAEAEGLIGTWHVLNDQDTTPPPAPPSTTSPATTDPADATPASAGPASMSPAATSPASTGPATTDPADATPASAGPAATNPATTGPADTASAATSPATTSPAGTTPTADPAGANPPAESLAGVAPAGA